MKTRTLAFAAVLALALAIVVLALAVKVDQATVAGCPAAEPTGIPWWKSTHTGPERFHQESTPKPAIPLHRQDRTGNSL